MIHLWPLFILLYVGLSWLAFELADAEPQWRALGWVWYVTVQFVMCVFMVIGWVLLIPFCLMRAWTIANRHWVNREGRIIDQWTWRPLNSIYGNPEDGVSGQQAFIWNKAGTARVPYMPNARAWWRAYCWSALRNSCDNLKYVFAWEHGPEATILGYKIGWWPENNLKVPLL